MNAPLPPRPRMPRPLQAYLFWRRTVPFLDWCVRRYGGLFRLWVPPWGYIVIAARPEALKAVFTADPDDIRPGEGYATVFRTVMGSNSLFLMDGDDHLAKRRIMLPPFHGEHVMSYAPLIAEVAAEEVEPWKAGDELRLEPAMKRIALEIILRAVFGVTDPERRDKLREMVPAVVDPGLMLQLAWMQPKLERFGPWRRHRQLKDATDRLIAEEIEEHRRDPHIDQRSDVLALLVRARYEDGSALSDRELIDQLNTLLIAGHETTATGLAWAFERLMRNPGALAKLRAELDEGDGPYLDAVVRETLRVRPVVVNVIRRVANDVEVEGYRVPAGTFLMAGLTAVHRDAEQYPDPEAFRPERHLEGSPPSYSWIPFGSGRRRCLGAPLATLEMKTVLSTILSKVELTAPRQADERIQIKHVTTVPARGTEAIVARRLGPPEAETSAVASQLAAGT